LIGGGAVVRVKVFVYLAFLTFGLCSCGSEFEPKLADRSYPIINGQEDTSDAHQAVVALMSNVGMCSGTLISKRVVLTAAHCVEGAQVDQFHVFFGNDIFQGSEVRRVSEISVYPQYDNQKLTGDIALIRMSSDAPFGVTPIPHLPSSLAITSVDIGTSLEYVGFGETASGDTGVKMTMTNDLDWICVQSGGCYHAGNPGAENTICQDQEPSGLCSGDSGGPAFIIRDGIEYVAGISSYVGEDCLYFGCSTKVDEYSEFVEEFVGGALGDSCQSNDECVLGFCVEGVCCNSICSGECQTCSNQMSMGICQTAKNGTDCSDGDICNGEEVCLLGKCMVGSPLSCVDQNPCTDDSCDAVDGCRNIEREEGASCADSDVCNGEEVCENGICVAGSPLECDDNNQCTDDRCDSQQGCLWDIVDDGTVCGQEDVCQAGICISPKNESGCGCGLQAGSPSALSIFGLLFMFAFVCRSRGRRLSSRS
jgi:hypothetical protein